MARKGKERHGKKRFISRYRYGKERKGNATHGKEGRGLERKVMT
jgi:hypothetical protein